MSYKNDIKKKIEDILSHDRDIEKEIEYLIKNDYKNIVEDYKKTGQSIEGITYEMLEVMEELLHNNMQKYKEILKHSSASMIETAKESARENIDKNHQLISQKENEFHQQLNDINDYIDKLNNDFKKKMDLLHHQLYDNIEHEKFHIEEILHGISIYSKDKSYKFFEENIKKCKESIEYIDSLSKTYKESIYQKTKTKTAILLYKLANRINQL